jgi:hypothetical protein
VPTRRLEVAALFALVVAFSYLVQPGGDNQKAHYAFVAALADGKPYVDEYVREPGLRTIDVTEVDGHLYATKAPGLAFASLPVYLVLERAGLVEDASPVTIVWALHLWSVVLPAIVLVLLVRRVAERLEPGTGLPAALILGVATLVLPFATVFFSHLLAATLGFAAFALLCFERREGQRLSLVTFAGLLAGLAITVEYPLGLVAVAVGIYALRHGDRLRRAAAYAAGALAGVAPMLAFNYWAFGSPTRLAYEGWKSDDAAAAEPFGGQFESFLPDPHVALALLLAPAGLGSLACAVVGAVLLYRRGVRAESLLVLGITAAYFVYNTVLLNPFGGASPGPRYLIPTLPFLAVALGPALRRIPGAALGLAVATGTFLAAATITSPLAAFDSQVVHRLRTGGYVRSVLDFVGIGGGAADLPFLLAVAFVAAVGVTALRPSLRRPDAPAFVVALVGWAVIGSQSRRVLEDNSYATDAVLLAAAAALIVSIVWVYRRGEPGLAP